MATKPTFFGGGGGLATSAARDNKEIAGVQKALQDPFWVHVAIDPERWNKFYPYRLAVYKRNGKGWELDNKEIPPFTLPISPESLNISTPFAITTTVTLGGIVEEHNGAPLRMITLSGTTGVLPLRGAVNDQALSSPHILTSIFAGSVGGALQVARDAQALFGAGQEPKNVVKRSETDEESGTLATSTGYYQFKLLERFFDAYNGLKKKKRGADYIMALEIWKDNNIFLVTPVEFTLRRSAMNPMEYAYNLSFRAWKRVVPAVGDGANVFVNLPAGRDPNKLAQVLNAIQGAQTVLQGVKNTLKGVRADIDAALFTPIREAVLFCKGALGVVTAATDLPTNIIKDLKEPLLEAIGLRGAVDATAKNASSTFRRAHDAFEDLSVQISKAAINSGRLGDQDPVGRKRQEVSGAAPGDKIADNPDSNFGFFSTVRPGDLNLRPETQKKIKAEQRRVQALKRRDFEKSRDSVSAVLANFEAVVGGSNPTFDRIYQTSNRVVDRTPSDTDFEVIFAMNAVVIAMNKLAVSSTVNQNEISALDFIAGLASRSGIAFTTPRSKFLVPFPYGSTLEQLSAQYLGTPDRWHEIAALNGLMDPYVDEIGFILNLLTNGNDNQVTVSNIDNLFANQQVWISSTSQQRTKRRISKIKTITPTIHVLTLTGEQDLAIYTVAAGASLQAFLPNTMNSQMSCYIPSDIVAEDDDFRYKSIPGVDYFDPLVRVGGIDLLLTPNGDLVVTPDGDGRLAVGLTNIVQKVRLALDTPRGSLLHHPDYGFPLLLGESTADLSAQDILGICKSLFRDDPTFSGVESAAILKDGPVVKIALSVGIAGTQQVIPITVEVNR